MTIKIQAYQKKGIKTKELVDEYEFCCWHSLFEWLKGFSLHKCPACKKKKEVENEYIYAYDKKLKRRVVHLLKDRYAIPLLTGSKFKYNSREINAIRKSVNKLRSLRR
jgi:hypothetical protein